MYWRNSATFDNRRSSEWIPEPCTPIWFSHCGRLPYSPGARLTSDLHASGDVMHFDLRTLGAGCVIANKLGGYIPRSEHHPSNELREAAARERCSYVLPRSVNSTVGGILYVEDGALKYRGSNEALPRIPLPPVLAVSSSRRVVMASYEASVKKALSSQRDLKRRKEHCSADPKKLATVGRALGHQVRIKRNATEYGLYTVSQARQESPDNIARMGETGRSNSAQAMNSWQCSIRR